MIKWFKRKLLHWAWDVDSETPEIGRDGRVLESNYIRIDIYRGEGGLAVETMVYDRKKDVNHIGFHIVHDDDELGNKLSKIITAESIKAL